MQAGHGTVGVCIVENCEVSATEGWADLQRAGMHSARILRQYYEGRVRDRAIALHLMDLKQAEHDGWLALVAPEYAGAAKCSLLIEQLSYELGESSAEQLAALCAISDSEIELSSAQFKDDLQMCSKNNRWIRSLPLCCNAACGKPLPQARPLCCAQCRAVVYCDKTCQTQVPATCAVLVCFVCCHFISEQLHVSWAISRRGRPVTSIPVCRMRHPGHRLLSRRQSPGFRGSMLGTCRRRLRLAPATNTLASEACLISSRRRVRKVSRRRWWTCLRGWPVPRGRRLRSSRPRDNISGWSRLLFVLYFTHTHTYSHTLSDTICRWQPTCTVVPLRAALAPYTTLTIS